MKLETHTLWVWSCWTSYVSPAALLKEFRTTRDLGNFIRMKLERPYIEAENRLSIPEGLACCGASRRKGPNGA